METKSVVEEKLVWDDRLKKIITVNKFIQEGKKEDALKIILNQKGDN